MIETTKSDTIVAVEHYQHKWHLHQCRNVEYNQHEKSSSGIFCRWIDRKELTERNILRHIVETCEKNGGKTFLYCGSVFSLENAKSFIVIIITPANDTEDPSVSLFMTLDLIAYLCDAINMIDLVLFFRDKSEKLIFSHKIAEYFFSAKILIDTSLQWIHFASFPKHASIMQISCSRSSIFHHARYGRFSRVLVRFTGEAYSLRMSHAMHFMHHFSSIWVTTPSIFGKPLRHIRSRFGSENSCAVS